MLPITRTTDAEINACPIRQVLVKSTGKWQLLILLSLEDGELRFGKVKKTIGDVTQRVLTENLRRLERDGYINRKVSAGPPLAVFYSLTPLGRSFVEILKPAIYWSKEHFSQVKKARKKYDLKSG